MNFKMIRYITGQLLITECALMAVPLITSLIYGETKTMWAFIIPMLILAALGAGKSQAYAWREKAVNALERELRGVELADTPLFARILVASAAAHLPRALRGELGVE